VTFKRTIFTFGYISVKTAIANGVVGQNVIPKEDVSRRRGSKFGPRSAPTGNQKARMINGITQYLQMDNR